MEDYDISELGFLPEECTATLPDNFYFLQNVIDNLPVTVSGDKFRRYVDELPTYDPDIHSTHEMTNDQKKYMYSVLCMIMNRYVWCTGVKDARNYNVLPQIIGIPLYEVSSSLGIAISLTHASVDLWNWKIPNGKEFSLDNLEILNTMTGNESEEWFYKVMIAIEGIGGSMLKNIQQFSQVCNSIERTANKFMFESDTLTSIILFLGSLSDNIKESTQIIERMKEKCVPSFFFNTLRIYLSGSINDNLPDGIKIDLAPIGADVVTLKFVGGSAAQSTLIQVYDKFFGIEHKESNKFLTEMRTYMPKQHREFLDNIESIRPFCQNSTSEIAEAFNDCVDNLAKFRKAHLDLIHTYIMNFVPKRVTDKDDKNAHGQKGTGGTDPVQFCVGIISETRRNKVPLRNLDSIQNLVDKIDVDIDDDIDVDIDVDIDDVKDALRNLDDVKNLADKINGNINNVNGALRNLDFPETSYGIGTDEFWVILRKEWMNLFCYIFGFPIIIGIMMYFWHW